VAEHDGERPPAILLGGEVGTLAVARALSQLGIEVWVLRRAERRSALSYSRACQAVSFAGASDVQACWLDWLERFDRPAAVLPCDDDGVELVARHRAELERLGYSPAEANDEVALIVLDKDRTYETARAAGIACPDTIVLRSERDLSRVAEELGFPCALKPLDSQRFGAAFGLQKAFVVHNEGELRRYNTRAEDRGLELLATEIVGDPASPFDSYFTYVDATGLPLFAFTKRKLRQFPVGFGLGTLHVSRHDAAVVEAGRRFVGTFGLRGFAAIEFKRDPRDGTLKLIECNHRFSDATEMVQLAGIDVGRIAYERALGQNVAPVSEWREGVALWFAVEDSRAFVAHRARGELTVGDWVRTLPRRPHFPFLRLSDPGPSLANAAWLARRVVRKLVRRAMR
jgi:D-aspartate ligase